MFDKIVLASNNQGKIREFRTFFAPYGIEIIPQSELDVPECEEPFPTFIENAIAKARHASKITGLPALADDSGICATALKGAPGIYSARYAGENPKSDVANNLKLMTALENYENKQVWYVCALALVRSELDPQPIIADGIWEGNFINEPRGENGFGYDPHFLLPEYRLTAAEIPGTLKNRISHRGRALTVLMNKLDELYDRAGLVVPEEPFHALFTDDPIS